MRLKSIALATLAAAAGLYAAGVGTLYAFQGVLLYSPDFRPAITASGDTGLTGYRVDVIPAGVAAPALYTWRHDGDPARPTVVFFHGKGATLRDCVSRLERLAEAGYSVRALEYRGFGGVPGVPTQDGLTADAVALIDALAREGTPPDRVVLYGWSLGTALAMQTAAARAPLALVLEAPAAAIVDIAAERYPVVPVRLLMRDQWDSTALVGRIRAPVLILHGEADQTIPVAHGRRLAAAFGPQATLVTFPDGRHANLDRLGGLERIVAFLRTVAG